MLTVIFNKKYKKSFKNLKSYVIIEKRVSLCPKLKAYLSCKHRRNNDETCKDITYKRFKTVYEKGRLWRMSDILPVCL